LGTGGKGVAKLSFKKEISGQVRTKSLASIIGCLAGAGLLLIIPSILGRSWITLITEIMIYGLFAVSFNLVLNYTGMLAFGHAAFFGLGAYSCALLLLKAKMPMVLGLIAAPIFAGAAGLVMGWISIRLTGFFFSFITMGLAQMVWGIFHHWRGGGGADGIFGVPLMSVFYSATNFYYLTLGIVAVSLAALRLIVNSPLGLTFQAIRDSPMRTEFVGVNYRRYKLASFVISAFFSGVAGALICLLNRCAYPELLHWMTSGVPLIMSLLGGMSFFLGPVVGAVVFVGFDKIVSSFTTYWPLTLGIIILLIVLFLRGGIIGFIFERRRHQAV